MRDIKVREVMSKNPVIVSGELSAEEAAKIMRKKGVSTLLVEDGLIAGIVTDRDFIVKVIAEGLDPSNTKVKEIMSSPVVMIDHDESIAAAAKIMSRRRIRKLPVIKDDAVIGILSENDIVRISPELLEITKQYGEISSFSNDSYENIEFISGKCERCGQYSHRLTLFEGMLVCPECYDSMR